MSAFLTNFFGLFLFLSTNLVIKLAALCEGRPWTPSTSTARAPIRPTSASSNRSGSPGFNQQQLGRTLSNNTTSSNGYNSPSNNGYNSPSPTMNGGEAPLTDKTRNEQYFNRLGNANASRSEHLPPSQGGKYAGFGSSPAPSSQNDSSLDVNDILNDPAAALSKGWSLLSTTLVAGANMINENVIKPTTATVTDPDFQTKVGGYVSSLGQKVWYPLCCLVTNSFFFDGTHGLQLLPSCATSVVRVS